MHSVCLHHHCVNCTCSLKKAGLTDTEPLLRLHPMIIRRLSWSINSRPSLINSPSTQPPHTTFPRKIHQTFLCTFSHRDRVGHGPSWSRTELDRDRVGYGPSWNGTELEWDRIGMGPSWSRTELVRDRVGHGPS